MSPFASRRLPLAALAVLALSGCLSEGTSVAADTAIGTDTATPVDTIADDVAGVDAVVDAADPTDAVAVGSCVGRCGSFDLGATCQCDVACRQYDNCCADVDDVCPPVDAEDDFLFAESGDCDAPERWERVTHIRDGDTVDLASGAAVRFLLVDTPEISSDDCQAWEAKAFTAAAVAASGDEVCLVADATSEDRDLYGRLLRYVYVREATREGAPINLNVRLIRLGHGRLMYPYAFGRRYEEVGKRMQALAEAEGQGGWGSCGW